MAYLDVAGINACISYLGSTYPSLVSVITLPEQSVQNRPIRAVKLASGGGNRRGVFFIGGVHARESVNPDMLLSLALKLCQAYTAGTGIGFGGKTYTNTDVRLVMEILDLFILPLVNPDGRAFTQSPAGDPMWRKNRANNAGTSCRGVDLNRNCEFLWPFTLGATSGLPCDDTFHGPYVFSEPEERNVRWLLNTYDRIHCFVDVHSYSELILYPWGDDSIQTSNSTQNFTNPVWDGLRGTAGGYGEYMPAADKLRFEKTALRIGNSIQAVRGRTYTPQPSFQLYPTTGTNEDYAYSRHRADPDLGKVYAFTFETGREFQPPGGEADWVIKEGSAGLFELALGCICSIDLVGSRLIDSARLHGLSELRDTVMFRSAVGRRLVELLDDHRLELAALALSNPRLAARIGKLVGEIAPAALGRGEISSQLIREAREVAAALLKKASPELARAVREALRHALHFRGRSVREGLREADKATAARKSAARKI